MTENSITGPAEEGTLADPEAQMAADKAELEQLNDGNKARLLALGRLGAQIDPASVISLRVDVLAEQVFGKDSAAMLQYKLTVQRNLAKALKQLEEKARQVQMAASALATPDQLRAMARANGLLGRDGKPLGS